MDRVAHLSPRIPFLHPGGQGYAPNDPFGVVLVLHAPGAAAVLADEGVVVVVHAVSARAVVAFPARRVVIIVAGVVGYAMLLADVAGDGTAVAAVADAVAAGRVAGRRRTRVQREKVLLQPHAHTIIIHGRVVRSQGQDVFALLGLPDVQPQLLCGAVLLRLAPTDGRIH